jgi:hypothetical protein
METLIQINRGFFRKDMFRESKESSAFLKKSAQKTLSPGGAGSGMPFIATFGAD